MAGQQPIEPSDVYRADGSRVPQRRTALGTVPAAARSLLPSLLRRTTAESLVTASAFAVAAVVTARAAEAARQVVEQAARHVVQQAAREAVGTRPAGSWIAVSVTRIEVRLPH